MSLANLQHGAINSRKVYEKWKNYVYLLLYYFWAPEGNNPRFIGLIWVILNGLKHCCWKASHYLAKCWSVAKSCPILCNPMDSSTPGFPVLQNLPEFAQSHVRWVGDTIQPSYPLLSPSPPAFSLSSIRVFSNESVLRIRWPEYWSFSFSISVSNEYKLYVY